MSIVADSSALFSLIVETDKNHRLAVKISKKFRQEKRSMFIPGDVFSEVINTLGKKISHQTAIKAGTILFTTEIFVITEATEQIRLSAFTKFQGQPKSVSFTDCLVMAFADEFETKEIFGFDESFHKNGYKRIGIDNS